MNDQPKTQPRVYVLLKQMLALHESEMDCQTCGEQLDCLADLIAAGTDPEKVYPAVQEHLSCCSSCMEEFKALITILKAEHDGRCK
jgi:hypothetical protein